MVTNAISFTKMHGLGNDFVIINALEKPFAPSQKQIRQLSNRHTGIGFDQLLIICESQTADFFCRIFNADGSEAEQCGNGLRCIARFIHEEKFFPEKTFRIETIAGIFPISISDYDQITLTMDRPTITHESLSLPQFPTSISVVSMGNPHAILRVNSIADDFHPSVIPLIQQHFPDGMNIGLMQIISKNHARLRTIERGAGETLACGSNACAAAVTGILHGWLETPTQIEFSLGSLHIEWEGKEKPVLMTGPATRIFSGEITI